MRKNFLLMMFAILLLGGCKKDKEVQVVNIVEKNPTVTASVTSVTIREKYGYPSDLKSVTVAYTKNSDYSSASMIPAEIQDDYYDSYYHYYYVKLTNLEPNTKYYYYCIFDTGYGSSEGKQRSFTTLENGGGGGGRFSVSSTTTVEFAPGNLYWDGSAFRFEENQWSFADSWNASHVSHFYWSKTASVAYASSYSDSGASTGDVFFTEASGFQVSGETEGGTWRTLSTGEWLYLLNTSGASSGARTDVNRFAKAMVNGVKGLLIFPDGYNGTAISGITGIATVNSTGAPYPSESIPTGTWASMESAGVVFLPAAGYRDGTSLSSVGSYGHYWSSTCKSSSYAYRLRFYSGDVNPQYSNFRSYGYSVRLVR